MSDGVIAFIFAVGAGTWMYARLMKSTNSPQSSVIGGLVVGVVGFVFLYFLMKYTLHI